MKTQLQPGARVVLTRPVRGRYSGYAGRPEFRAPAGTTLIISSGPHPAVTGKERDFYVAYQSDKQRRVITLQDIEQAATEHIWLEGFSLWPGTFRATKEVTFAQIAYANQAGRGQP